MGQTHHNQCVCMVKNWQHHPTQLNQDIHLPVGSWLSKINYNNSSARVAGNSCNICTLRCRHHVHLNHSNSFCECDIFSFIFLNLKSPMWGIFLIKKLSTFVTPAKAGVGTKQCEKREPNNNKAECCPYSCLRRNDKSPRMTKKNDWIARRSLAMTKRKNYHTALGGISVKHH